MEKSVFRILLVFLGILFIVLAFLILSPSIDNKKPSGVVPTATPSATLAPLKSVPIFVPQNQDAEIQAPSNNQPQQPAQSSSTTNNSTTSNTTNNPPAPTQAQGQGPVNKIIDNVGDTIDNLLN